MKAYLISQNDKTNVLLAEDMELVDGALVFYKDSAVFHIIAPGKWDEVTKREEGYGT